METVLNFDPQRRMHLKENANSELKSLRGKVGQILSSITKNGCERSLSPSESQQLSRVIGRITEIGLDHFLTITLFGSTRSSLTRSTNFSTPSSSPARESSTS